MAKVKQAFDTIHTCQQTYRTLLDCMARPGKRGTLQIDDRYNNGEFSAALLTIADTLLDQEVTFHLYGNQHESTNRLIKWNTFSVPTVARQADFIFVDDELVATDLEHLLNSVKVGTLSDPHQSATIVVCTPDFNQKDVALCITGPGIKDTQRLVVSRYIQNWLIARERIDVEYPLGFEIMFVSLTGDVIALPRTTKIERVDDEWDM